MKAFLYCRVAHNDDFCLAAQAAALRQYAGQAGYDIIGVACEHSNGLTLNRPALHEVTKAVLAGKVDLVVVQSVARIGRDRSMTQQYIDLLTENNTKLLCIREQLIFSDQGEALIGGNKNAECPSWETQIP
ncbi:MAG: recombinase family protein [Clostridiales bacterium]|nr:recombinase family protein [Clostridiales bacterium]